MFTVSTSDPTLVDTRQTYSVVNCLADWPSNVYSTAPNTVLSGFIDFEDPCDNPFTFDVPTQNNANNVLTGDFSGTNVDFYLNAFTITPNFCTLTYTITGITEAGQSSSSVPLVDLTSDLTFDGANSGSLSDG